MRQAREVGTSAGVLLPRAWLNKEVVVTLKDLNDEEIAKGVFEILLEKGLLPDVKGVYLIGSYARGDYDAGSDVDVLVVTEKTNKLIKLRDYEIVLVSEKNLLKNLKTDLYKLLAVKEAKTILNDELMNQCRKIKPKLSVKELKEEIRSVLKINSEAISDCGEQVPDSIIYSLVLRLRELYLMKNLLRGKMPGKADFQVLISKGAYDAYLRVKRDKREKNGVSINDALELVEQLKKWLKE